MTNKKINKLSDEKTDKLFSELIREKMDNKTFTKWVMGWFSADELCDMAEEWEIDIKKETLQEYKNLL